MASLGLLVQLFSFLLFLPSFGNNESIWFFVEEHDYKVGYWNFCNLLLRIVESAGNIVEEYSALLSFHVLYDSQSKLLSYRAWYSPVVFEIEDMTLYTRFVHVSKRLSV